MHILEEILSKKKKIECPYQRTRKIYSFSDAIKNKNKKGKIALIAEIKSRSPSRGEIQKIKNIKELARVYQENGATCISILTEENYFGGSIHDLRVVSENCTIPILRKDFITDLDEIKDTYNVNADCLLLITSIVGPNLKNYLAECETLGIEALVEVHTKNEVTNALHAGAKIIGINNRNLDTFEVNLDTTNELIGYIPDDVVVISESGISKKEDIKYLSQRINAVLVGTEIMKSINTAEKVEELSSVTY